MRAYQGFQLFKNGLYRTTGEVASLAGAPNGAERTLRVLMYHKVNDLSPNPITVPTAVFAEQMSLLPELGYTPVSLAAVRDHYVLGAPLPGGAVLITFDDGYLDNLENAFPILHEHGFPAVVFVPVAYLDGSRPLPHEEPFRLLGVRNATLSWNQLAELEAGGVRIESHGIGHRRLAELPPDQALREIAMSKLTLEEALGREVEAYAYVKGTRADYRAEHASLVQQAGYKLGFSAVAGPNGPRSDRFQLMRYAIEPFSARAFELVLSGACDVFAVKDGALATRVRRSLRKAVGMASR